jgi:hypothetical membrane protein
MNNRHITWPRSSFQMTLLLVGIAVVGIGTSMLLTDDPRWLQWHLSRLGEGGHISSGIFNLTLCLVALLFVVIGGFRYMISGGDEESAEAAKNTVINSLIGIVLIILSYSVVQVVVNLVSRSGGGAGNP